MSELCCWSAVYYCQIQEAQQTALTGLGCKYTVKRGGIRMEGFL